MHDFDFFVIAEELHDVQALGSPAGFLQLVQGDTEGIHSTTPVGHNEAHRRIRLAFFEEPLHAQRQAVLAGVHERRHRRAVPIVVEIGRGQRRVHVAPQVVEGIGLHHRFRDARWYVEAGRFLQRSLGLAKVH